MEKENKGNIYYRFSSEEELNRFIGETENVAVLVNTYGRKSISKEYEKEIERYCKRHKYNVVHTFLFKEEQYICDMYKEIIGQAYEDEKLNFTKIIVLDIRHISKYISELMSLDVMLRSNGIQIMILNCDISLAEYLNENLWIDISNYANPIFEDMFIYGHDELKDENTENKSDSNKKDVVLFINNSGGSLKNYEAKKQILISYCEERNYNIVDIIKYEEDEDDSHFYKTKLDLILKYLNKFDDLVIYDMKELSDYAETLYVILEMLADNYIRVESLCDGRYFGLYNSDIEFEVKLRENIPSLSDKLIKIVD